MDDSKVVQCAGKPDLVKKAFSQFPSGVSVLAIQEGDEKHALVASSFMVGVSLEPVLVAMAVQKTSETWPRIRDAASIGVSVLGSHHAGLTRQLAGRDRMSRFSEVAFELGEHGALFIDDAALWLEASVYAVSEAGDHWMALLEVHKLGSGKTEPLIWHGAKFRELLPETALATAG